MLSLRVRVGGSVAWRGTIYPVRGESPERSVGCYVRAVYQSTGIKPKVPSATTVLVKRCSIVGRL